MNHVHLKLLVTREMPYGKYQSRLIADLPGRYLTSSTVQALRLPR